MVALNKVAPSQEIADVAMERMSSKSSASLESSPSPGSPRLRVSGRDANEHLSPPAPDTSQVRISSGRKAGPVQYSLRSGDHGKIVTSARLSSMSEAPAIWALSRRRKRWCWLDPEKSGFLMRWDLSSASLLVVISILTPFEAGFLPCSDTGTVRWVINQAINLFFFVDFVLQFFVPYPVPTRYGQRFVFDNRAIVRNYCRSWMIIDFISIVPYELIAPCGGLSALRTVRLLRLLKLLRLLRGMRILQRWQAEAGVSYRKTMLYRLFGMVCIASHWIACALGMASRMQGDSCLTYDMTDVDGCVITWLTTANLKPSEIEDLTPSSRDLWGTYLLALHASMSILVHPHHYMPTGSGERVLFVALMLIGGFIWTQVISRSTAICTSLDRHNIIYQQLLDDVNTISSELGLSRDVRVRLRKFFYRTKKMSQTETWEAITKQMSPQLRRDTSREINKFWVLRIGFLTRCSIAFITDVSEALKIQMFSEEETFGERWHLYILKEGLATRQTHLQVIAPGAVWGEDHLLLTCERLLTDNTAVALVFSQCQVLHKEVFHRIADEYPEHSKTLQRARIRQAFICGIKREAHKRRSSKVLEALTEPASPIGGSKEEDRKADVMQRATKARTRNLNSRSRTSIYDEAYSVTFEQAKTAGRTSCSEPASRTAGFPDLKSMAETLESIATQVTQLADAQREMAAQQAILAANQHILMSQYNRHEHRGAKIGYEEGMPENDFEVFEPT